VSTSPLLIDRHDDGVVALTLNLPERRNAMTEELTAAWVSAVAALKGDRSVRCVVVLAEGKAFCAGGDLSWIEGDGSPVSPDMVRDKMLPFYKSWLSIRELEVPVIAAIQGPAVGAGLCLALACDLRFAAPEASFSAPFTKLGIHPGMASTFLLPEAMGMSLTRDLLYTGRRLTAEEALAAGVITRIMDAGALREGSLEVAHEIAATAPIAVRLTKAGLALGPRSLEDVIAWEALAQPITMATEDLKEGMRAAQEKRVPRFSGR
jgi:enoyl-CoA hydratase